MNQRPYGADLRTEAGARYPGEIFNLNGYVYCVSRERKPIDCTGLTDADVRNVKRKEQ